MHEYARKRARAHTHARVCIQAGSPVDATAEWVGIDGSAVGCSWTALFFAAAHGRLEVSLSTSLSLSCCPPPCLCLCLCLCLFRLCLLLVHSRRPTCEHEKRLAQSACPARALDAPIHVLTHALVLAAQVVRCLLKYGARVHLVDESVCVHERVLSSRLSCALACSCVLFRSHPVLLARTNP